MRYHVVLDATVPKGTLRFEPQQRTVAEMVEGQPRETDIFVNPEDFPGMTGVCPIGFECGSYSFGVDKFNTLHIWRMGRD